MSMIPVALILLVLVVGCGLVKKPATDKPPEGETAEGGEPVEITAFSFSHGGSSTFECFFYSAQLEEGKTHLYTEGLFSGGPILDIMTDDPLLERLGEIVGKYGLVEWDGFNKTESSVMDGSNFSLDLTLADGTTVSANGSNSFPSGYSGAYGEICALFEDQIQLHESELRDGE